MFAMAIRRKYVPMLVFLLVLLLGLPLGIGPVSAAGSEGAPIRLVVDGQLVQTTEPVLLTQGRTLVPLRVLMETLGAQVQWDGDTRSVSVTRAGGGAVRLWIDNRLIRYEDASGVGYDVCDVAPRIIADRTYVPLRLVAGALGLGVEWDDTSRQVLVDTGGGGSRTHFYDMAIMGIEQGQTVSGSLALSLRYGEGAPQDAALVKYFLMDPVTGDGKIAALAMNPYGIANMTPDPAIQGEGVLAVAVCDSAGGFLAGTAAHVRLSPTPSVRLVEPIEGQRMTDDLELRVDASFMSTGVEYEFTILSDGSSTRSPLADPFGIYTHSPVPGQTGPVAIRAIAYDAAGNVYTSQTVTVQADVPPPDTTPQVNLRRFREEHVGRIPVTLSITRNFDALTTQYWAQNAATGETVLLDEKPWGDYQWFPGPEMAGRWEVYVKVTAPGGQTYTSNSISATVPSDPGIVLNGIGPGQVITGEVTFHSTANIPLQQVEYILSNPFNGSQRTLGVSSDPAESFSWTPEGVNEGERNIRVVGTLANGQTITSEVLDVTIYLGRIHSAQPVIERGGFIDLVTPMALETQKQTGMSAALQVAQAILETGWGQSLPVDRYNGRFSNNLFGIKGTGSAGSVLSSTMEEYMGTMFRTNDYFRAYHSVHESWDDHTDLLIRAARYQPFRDVMFHSESGAHALKRCGYATDSAYPDKLIAIIRQYGLDKLDWQKL